MSATGDLHFPGNCWCGTSHMLIDVWRPSNPFVGIGVTPLSEQRIREIIREEIAKLRSGGEEQEPVCEHLWAVAVLGPYAFHEGERIRSVEFFWYCQKCRTVEESQWDR